MTINGLSLLALKPFVKMLKEKLRYMGTSHGLSEAGYDITILQQITFHPPDPIRVFELCQGLGNYTEEYHRECLEKALFGYCVTKHTDGTEKETIGRFVLASSVEEFQMPSKVVATVKDKSTWARQGLSVFNTVAEPGWNGFLTLELVFHGHKPVEISSGQGIAQVLFDELSEDGDYADGKYQNQENKPVEARG